MTTQELAQKILDCNNIARKELRDIYDNKSIAEKLCTLIDDIEKLCKEQLQQNPNDDQKTIHRLYSLLGVSYQILEDAIDKIKYGGGSSGFDLDNAIRFVREDLRPELNKLQQKEDLNPVVPDDTHDGDALVESFRKIIAMDVFKQYVIGRVTQQQEERRSITWQLFERGANTMDLMKILKINAYIQHTGDIFLDGKKVLSVALDHSAALEDSEDELMLTDDQLEKLFDLCK